MVEVSINLIMDNIRENISVLIKILIFVAIKVKPNFAVVYLVKHFNVFINIFL